MTANAPITREAIVTAARGWIGTPYHHQASVRGVGADCLGFVRGIWREFVGAEAEPPPAYTRDWAEAHGAETLLAAAERHLVAKSFGRDAPDLIAPGDVLVFRYQATMPAKHVGIATGRAAFIHAVEGAGVREVALLPWWKRRIAGVFSFPGVAD